MGRRGRAVREVALLFGLPPTAQLLLAAVAEVGRELSISHLRERTGRSERAIRLHLKSLVEMGLVRKRVGRTERKRRACFYSFDPASFAEGVRRSLRERSRRLEELLREHFG
jgi:DNA-binding transcriptional ArsR family regulator